jgi:hypothetical protein
LFRNRSGTLAVLLGVAMTCIALAAATTAAAAPAPVPRAEQQRIIAMFGRTYLPAVLPPSYVFSEWKSQPGSASAYRNSLVISFGKHGDLLQWSVEDPADPNGYAHDACSAHPFLAVVYRVGSRRIVYQSGNHGTTSTLCLRSVAVVVWNGHTLSPRVLARFAASARAVG